VAAPDPVDDARALLALCRLVYRSRVAAARCGVQPAGAAAGALVPVGARLAAAVTAVTAAERAETPEARAAALEEVIRAGEDLGASIQGSWEGIGGLVGVLLAGVRGDGLPKMGRDPEG
jgi:hypothetical protein